MMPLYEWAYHSYFRVTTDGWHHIPEDKPVLLVGSHNGGISAPDTHMFIYDWVQRFGAERPVYGLMHPRAWDLSPQFAKAAARMGAVRAHPKVAIAALREGASILVYPGGAKDTFRPHRLRGRILLNQQKGFIKLALRQQVPIIPLVSWGAHETLIVIEDCYRQAQLLHRWGMPWPFGIDPEVLPVYLGLPWGVAVGALPNIPMPAKIHTRVCPPITFDRYGRKVLADRAYVDECYATVERQMQAALDDLSKP